MDPITTTIVSALTALLTSLLVIYITQYLKNKSEEKQERKSINLKYLNPLRLYSEENHFRLNKILRKVTEGNGQYKNLLYVPDAAAVSEQKAEWFNGEGCFLISTCYFTGCLFYQFKKVREDLPYLRLGKKDDTELLNLILQVNLAFLKDLGVYYAIQSSVGNDMYLLDQDRVISYREFCQLLQDPKKRVWFDKLIDFYIDAGRGNTSRVEAAVAAIQELSNFLDRAVGGGESLERRYRSEKQEQALVRRSNNPLNRR